MMNHVLALPAALLLAGGALPGTVPSPRASSGVPDVQVATPEQLREALANSACGTQVVVAAGSYPGDFRLARECEPAQLLVVRASGAAVFPGGTFTLAGRGLVLSGMTFEGGAVRVEGSRNRVTRNTLRNGKRAAIQTRGSHHLIDRNEVGNTEAVAIEISLGNDGSKAYGNRVERNYVHHQRGQGNGHEGIRVLTDSYHRSGTVIANNLLEQVDVPGEGEAISIKTSGVVVRGNTLLDSPKSHFTNRHGTENLYEANYFENAGGMTVMGDRHLIRHSVFRNAIIKVHAGTGTQDTHFCLESPPTRPTRIDCMGVHPAARHVTITDNDIQTVIVGNQYENANPPNSVPAQFNRIIRSGRPTMRHQYHTTVEPGAPRGVTARKLTPAEVGPRAPDLPLLAVTAIGGERPLLDDGAPLLCEAGTADRRVTVRSAAELTAALGAAGCGSEIVLADGAYAGRFTLAATCPLGRPVTVRAEHPERAVLTGQLALAGEQAVVTGLTIAGEIVVQGRGARITRNLVTRYRAMTLRDGAVGNRIDHNEFRDTYYFKPYVRNDAVSGGDIIVSIGPRDAVKVSNNRIDRNHFRGTIDVRDSAGLREPAAGVAQGASLYVGTADVLRKSGVYYPTNTVVESNLWTNWKKKTAIETKSHEMIFRGNVVDSASVARVINRNGTNSAWIANDLGGHPLFLYDEYQTAAANRVQLTRVFADGNVEGAAQAKKGVGVRAGANGARLIGNTGRLVLGDNEGAKQLVPLRGATVEAHQGEVVRRSESETTVRPTTTVKLPPTAALTAADVGMRAEDASCGAAPRTARAADAP